jgi:hypothetical protein
VHIQKETFTHVNVKIKLSVIYHFLKIFLLKVLRMKCLPFLKMTFVNIFGDTCNKICKFEYKQFFLQFCVICTAQDFCATTSNRIFHH